MVPNIEMDMKETTLGYIEYDGCYLMLYRDKKENDLNKMKWVGVGGHLEEGETPDECFIREVREETGIILTEDKIVRRGVVDFVSDIYENERMFLYTATVESSEFSECDEGTLKWIKKDEVLDLNLWEGDKYFLKPLIAEEMDIELTLTYEGENLVSCVGKIQ